MMHTRRWLAPAMIACLSACRHDSAPSPDSLSTASPLGQGLPDVSVTKTLPQFAREVNEVQISDSFNDVDPTWVIGALVEFESGKIYSMDNYLKASAKPTVSPQTEVVFRSFIDNGVAANAQWLEFLKGEVSDTTRAEVAVTKTMKVSVDSQSVDRAQLARQLQNNKITEREKYGVIIGFTNYALSATYFKNAAAGATVSGYGAKIGGNWYSKSEHSRIHHRIVAVWSPLPFVLDSPASGAPVDLQQSTLEAIRMNRISVQPLPVPAGDTAHILRKGLF